MEQILVSFHILNFDSIVHLAKIMIEMTSTLLKSLNQS